MVNRRNRARGGAGANGRSAVRQLSRELHGYQVNLRHLAPPPVVKRPYYNLTLNLVIPTAATETFYRPSDIGGAIVGQFGLAAADIGLINFKVHQVDVYTSATASSTDRPAVSLQVSSTIPSISDAASGGTPDVFYSIIKRLQDVGNLSESARVGFHWPMQMADMPLSASQSFCLFAASGNCANTTVRVHLKWSFNSDSAPVFNMLGNASSE
eukprot:103923_1